MVYDEEMEYRVGLVCRVIEINFKDRFISIIHGTADWLSKEFEESQIEKKVVWRGSFTDFITNINDIMSLWGKLIE